MEATAKQITRRLARCAGGSRADAWPGQKSAAHEIRDNPDVAWRREWLRRGVGQLALRGPVGRLP